MLRRVQKGRNDCFRGKLPRFADMPGRLSVTLNGVWLCIAVVPAGTTLGNERFSEPTCPIGSGGIGTPQQGQTEDLRSGSQLDRLAVRRVPVGFGPSFLAGFQGLAIRQTLGREPGWSLAWPGGFNEMRSLDDPTRS